MFSSIMMCSVLNCLCIVFVQVLLLPCLVFDQYLNGLFLYCSAASKHKQLLVTVFCGDDHSRQGSANYQSDTSGKYRSVRAAVSGWILSSGVLYLFIQKYSAWGPFLAKGLSSKQLFAYCLNLGHEELPGLLLCKFSPSRCRFRNKAKLGKKKPQC